MKMTRTLLLSLLAIFVLSTVGCDSEPTRKIDPAKMSPQEKAIRKDKAGEL